MRIDFIILFTGCENGRYSERDESTLHLSILTILRSVFQSVHFFYSCLPATSAFK